jgi:hypothetical protein
MLDIRALQDSQTQNLRLHNLPKNEYLFRFSLLYRLSVIHGSIGEPGGNDPWLQSYVMLDEIQDLRAAPER